MKKLIIPILFACFPTQALDIYVKAGVGYVTNQTRSVDTTPKQSLYYQEQDKYSYNLDLGCKIDNFDLGLGVNGLINQGRSSRNHKPYNAELFVDYNYKIRDNWKVVIGGWYKVLTNEFITRDNGKEYHFSEEKNIKNRFTARIGVLKDYGDFVVGVYHRSQWLVGKPFNRDWEYYKTEVVVFKYF